MHLFVYGTLRRSASHPMHRLILPATFIGPGRFRGKLYDLGNYPAAIASADPADAVHGEVYLLHEPADTLAALDRYEGCAPDDPAPHEYIRVVADIRLETNGTPVVPAQIYLYGHPVNDLRRIEQGDYLAWLARWSPRTAGGSETRTPPADSTAASC